MKPLPDADQAAALGRHRHARAGAGAARAHRLLPSCPAAGVVGEAMVAFVLADAYRAKFGGDHIDDVREARRPLRGADRVAAALNPALVFIGFMGAGKSTRGPRGGGGARRAAADTDALLEDALGEPIAGVLRPRGRGRRSGPRRRSSSRRCSTRADGGVDRARRRGAAAPSACARRCAATPSCWSTSTSRPRGARAAGEGRPLARDRDAFAALFAEPRRAVRGRRRRDRPRHRRPARRAPRRSRRSRAAPAGLDAAVGDERLGRLPGLDRRGRGRAGAVAGPGPALRRHRRDGRGGARPARSTRPGPRP